MITKWQLGNFKCIEEETELELAPLTILAGANSSGKSTLIQSILLVSQSLPQGGQHPGGLTLNGRLVSLGSFDEVLTDGTAQPVISIGMELEDTPDEGPHLEQAPRARATPAKRRPEPPSKFRCRLTFDAEAQGSPAPELLLRPRVRSSKFEAFLKDGTPYCSFSAEPCRSDAEIAELRHRYPEGRVDYYSLALRFDVQLDNKSLLEVQTRWARARPMGCSLFQLVPAHSSYDSQYLVIEYDPVETETEEVLQQICSPPFAPRLRSDFASTPTIPEDAMPFLQRELKLPSAVAKESRLPWPWKDGFDAEAFTRAVTALPGREKNRILKRLLDRDFRDRLKKVVSREVASEYEERADKSPEEHGIPQLNEVEFPNRLQSAASAFLDLLACRVRYLGPLRDKPRALYPRPPDPYAMDVGLRGEYTPAVLNLQQHSMVWGKGPDAITEWRPTPLSGPGSSNAREPARLQMDENQSTLGAAVGEWLDYLGLGRRFQAIDKGKGGHEVRIAALDPNSFHDLTQLGVGVSQVLPILTMGLLAEKGSTLIFEQPELHLHPAVQSRIADFFLAMALSGKQCIVETHSEHIINRLRLRIAEAGREKKLESQIGIYFVESRGARASFRRVPLNEYGAIDEWPEGFFDQSHVEAEEILNAAMKKRLEGPGKG